MIVMTHTGSCCSTFVNVSMEFQMGRSGGTNAMKSNVPFFMPSDFMPPGIRSMRTRQGTPRGTSALSLAKVCGVCGPRTTDKVPCHIPLTQSLLPLVSMSWFIS
ncbi:hypothetical protein PST407_03083 [Pseudomonas syringae pv. tomato]|nr:hypothetical protein PST407_03083 [Pseudomonas syringae pv. tomato]